MTVLARRRRRSQYAVLTQNNSLVASWPLDTDGSSSLDAAQDMSVSGTSITHGEGRPGGAALFNTDADNYTLAAGAAADAVKPTTNDFAIAFQFRLDSLDATSRRILWWNNASSTVQGAEVLIASNGQLQFRASDGAGTDISGTWTHAALAADTWYFVVINLDRDANATLYLDSASAGTPFSIAAGDGDDWSGSQAINIGPTAVTMNGRVSNVEIWNRLLTSHEVNLKYNNGWGRRYPYDTLTNQRVTFDIPTALQGTAGFNILWPRLTAHQACNILKGQGLVTAAGAAALPGAIDQDYYDASGTVNGTMLADGALGVIEVSDWSGTWINEAGNDSPTPLDRVIWYGDWLRILSGSITAFADGGGGQVVVTSAAHGISENNRVVITGTTSYNGTFTATNVTTNTFEIAATWVTDDATGSWTSGKTAIDTREDLQTLYAADELGVLQSGLTDVEIEALLWTAPQSAAGGSYAPTMICTTAPYWIEQTAKPTGAVFPAAPVPGTLLATAADNQVESVEYDFVPGDVGKAVIISAGTGWTPGTYVITGVAADVATLDANVGTHPLTGGTWVMQQMDHSIFTMRAQAAGAGQGTNVSWLGSDAIPSGSTWATALGTHGLLSFASGTDHITAQLVDIATPAKTVEAFWDGDYADPGQQNAGLWMDRWIADVVTADAATEDDHAAAGSQFKKFIQDLNTALVGDPDAIMWYILHNPVPAIFFAGFAPTQFEQTEVHTNRSGATVGGLGHTKTIASIADDPGDPGANVIVTLADNRLSHIDPDVGVTGEQSEHTYTFFNCTGTPALNGTHKVAYNDPGAAEKGYDNTTMKVIGVMYVATGTGQCYGTHAPMQDSRWPVLNGYNLETIFGDELDSFDIKRGTAGSWQEHDGAVTNGVLTQWRGDERFAVFTGIWRDYYVESVGALKEYVSAQFPTSIAFDFRYHVSASAIWPSASGYQIREVPFTRQPKIAGVLPVVQSLDHKAEDDDYWSRKSRSMVGQQTYAGTDAVDWNMLLWVSSRIHSAAACATVPQAFWHRIRTGFTGWTNNKYFEWMVRMLWLTGWQPILEFEQTFIPTQAEIDIFIAAKENAETRIGGSDFQGFVLGDPNNEDLFSQKVIRVCRDVAGKFLNIVLVRPDEYDSGNFVVNGSDIDVVDAAGTTTLMTIPNASVTEETDNGAWITQTAL